MVDLEVIRLRAFKAALKPDYVASLRRIFRWYSKEFSTPLHEVEELPLEYIIQHYFEDHYCNMEAVQLEEEMDELVLTAEEREELEESNDASDDAFEAAIRADLEKAAAKAKPAKPKENQPVTPEEVSVKFDTEQDANLKEDWFSLDPLAPPPRKR